MPQMVDTHLRHLHSFGFRSEINDYKDDYILVLTYSTASPTVVIF